MQLNATIGLLIVVALVSGALLLWSRAKRGRDASREPPAAVYVDSYENVKQAIRNRHDEDQPLPPPPSKPSKPLSDVFALSDEHSFVSGLLEHASYRSQRVGAERLTPGELAVLSILGLEADVMNGGFDQYFFNSSGNYANRVVASLELIQARSTATIVDRALSVFPNGAPSPDRETRWRQMDELSEQDKEVWNQADNAFFDYPDNLSALLSQYARAHRSEFPDAAD